MRYFAQIKDNYVINVVVADQSFIDSGAIGSPFDFIETFWDGSFRREYASIGYFYHKQKDVFVRPKIYNSWVMDDSIADWVSPISKPNDGKIYEWDENIINWKEIPQPATTGTQTIGA